jgi:gas vesicle protein
MDSDKKVILGVLAGAAIGVAIGMLLAPDSGSNTRKKIAGKGAEYIDDLEEKFNDLLDKMGAKAKEAKEEDLLVADHSDRTPESGFAEAAAPVK